MADAQFVDCAVGFAFAFVDSSKLEPFVWPEVDYLIVEILDLTPFRLVFLTNAIPYIIREWYEWR